jgi:hypothetical protein
MTITREQVADLRPGDVVEMRFPSGASLRGPLTEVDFGAGAGLGIVDVGWQVRLSDGTPAWALTDLGANLTVVSRAPRRLYVNHPRTKPVPGDVARDAGSEDHGRVWVYGSDTRKQFWRWSEYPSENAGPLSTVRLRLLVDGETGQVVPW